MIRAGRLVSLRALSSAVNGPSSSTLKNVVFVDGVRTPFCKSNTNFDGMKPHHLGGAAIKGLLKRSNLEKESIDYVCMGTVIQETNTPNVARESMLVAGLPESIPSHTVSMACISSNQAVCTAANMIATGHADAVVAGGVDTLSDPPIRVSQGLRAALVKAGKARDIQGYLAVLAGLKLKDINIPSVSEYISAESMGKSADRLTSSFGISRLQQDEYAIRTHSAAEAAQKAGHLNDVVPMMTKNGLIKADNTIRVSTLEELAKLKPVFIKGYGSITAGNASPITDGASASLVMSEERAQQLGMTPKVYIRDYVFTAQDPFDQLLIGPAYATSKLMLRNNLSWKDIGVIELHEAFAGQVLCVATAMGSEYFCKSHIGVEKSLGEIPMDKLNKWGGSVSLGHPFGATGVRLVTMAANRLIHEHALDPNAPKYALVTGCAAGGLAHAMLVERYP